MSVKRSASRNRIKRSSALATSQAIQTLRQTRANPMCPVSSLQSLVSSLQSPVSSPLSSPVQRKRKHGYSASIARALPPPCSKLLLYYAAHCNILVTASGLRVARLVARVASQLKSEGRSKVTVRKRRQKQSHRKYKRKSVWDAWPLWLDRSLRSL